MTTDQFRTKIREVTGTNTNDYSDASLIRDLNSELSMIQIGILRDRGVLEFDDTNYSDVPIGTFTVSASGFCKIIEDGDSNKILTIHKVAYLVGDKYVDVPRRQLGEGEQEPLVSSDTKTVPTEYYEVGSSIVFPGISGGTAKVWFDREMDFLTTSDTTKVPGIPSAYHNLAAYRTALNYDNLPDNKVNLCLRRIQMEEEKLGQFEANRRADEATVMTVERHSGL
jgi:hypothetical protein